MRVNNSEKYRKYKQKIRSCSENGQLINLTEIYNDYGRPKNQSPKRFLRNRTKRNGIGYGIETRFDVEQVIQNADDEVLANSQIASDYLHKVDEKHFVFELLGYKQENE